MLTAAAPTSEVVAFNVATVLVDDAASVLDAVEVSPPDAYAMALLQTLDPRALSVSDQPRYLQAWARVEAYAAARRLAAVALVAEPAPNPQVPAQVADRVAALEADFGAHEVAVALRIPLGTAHAQVHYARRLTTHLPATGDLLAAGTISYQHAVRAVRAADGVEDPTLTRQVEQLGLRRAHTQTPGELAGSITRAVADLDPTEFTRRHRDAALTSEMTLTPLPDAMAELYLRGPLTDLAAVTQAADAHAATTKAAGDPRPLGLLRIEALRRFAEQWLTTAQPTAHGRPVELHLAVTPDALAGLTDTPAVLLGLGAPVPADHARALLAAGAALRRLLIDPTTGHLLDYGRRTWTAPPDLAAYLTARHPIAAAPGATTPATRADLDHAVPFPAGPTTPDNLSPQPRSWHRAKTHGGYQIHLTPEGTVTWTTPKGQTTTIEPFDYRLGP